MNSDNSARNLNEDQNLFFKESQELLDICEDHISHFRSEKDFTHLQHLIRTLHALTGSAEKAGYKLYGQEIRELVRQIVPDLMIIKDTSHWINLTLQILDQFRSLSVMYSEDSKEHPFEEGKLSKSVEKLHEILTQQKKGPF